MATSSPIVLVQYEASLTGPDGNTYRARACGRVTEYGTWEGWVEFLTADGGRVLRTDRETTQPNLTDLRYWATGLERVYLDGALRRALPERDASRAHGTANGLRSADPQEGQA